MESSLFVIDRLRELKSLIAALHLVHTHEELFQHPDLEPGFEVMQSIFHRIDALISTIEEHRAMAEEEIKKFEQGFAYEPKKKDG